MARPIFEKGDRVVALEDCGSFNEIDERTRGVVLEDFHAGDSKVFVEFGNSNKRAMVYPKQIDVY